MTRGFWPPAIVLAIGALLATVGVQAQYSLELREPLATAVPDTLEGFGSSDLELTADEKTVTGVTSYLSRFFRRTGDTTQAGINWFSVYVGYYDRQTRGKTIHSPKNCLPGGGWEPLTSTTATIATASGPITVNRYLIQNGQRQALVLYWYQGRGRVAFDEYAVKWDLLRDAAIKRRSEEALVRIIVPVTQNEDASFALATRAASRLVPSLFAALPG